MRVRCISVCALVVAAACGPAPARPAPAPSTPTPALPPVSGTADANGENDGVDANAAGPGLSALSATKRARFERIEAPQGAHPLVCDLTPHRRRLMVSYAVKPIDVDGARIFAYTPGQSTPWRLVFDWDRGGTPHGTHEVGGQGLTRIRSIDGRLYATDSDAPLYGGFGLTDAPFEDYVFVSDRNGRFPPLQKDDAPPTTTRIAPLAFHIFDIVRYRGALVASGGTIAVHDRSGTRFPGGVFVGPLDRGRLEPRWTPGAGKRVGVVRTTYMHRFGGRLYMGFQNNERRARWDLAVLSGDPLARATAAPTLLRVTKRGGWLTRRFASTRDRLYWIASGYPRDGRPATLFVSTDGASFRRVPLPSGAGAPQDMQVIGNTRYLLTARALYRAGPDDRFVELAAAPKGAFDKFNTFCSAPLSVLGDHLYAGSTRDGALYRIVPQ